MGCSEVSGSSFSLHADRCRSKPLRAKPGPVASNSTFSLCCEHAAHGRYMEENFLITNFWEKVHKKRGVS